MPNISSEIEKLQQLASMMTEEQEVELDTMKFYKDNCKTLPTLFKLATRTLVVPASSAPVERVFSHGGIIMRPHRSQLKDDMVEKLIFLKMQHKNCLSITRLRLLLNLLSFFYCN
jgi:hypothetical protein